MLISKIIKTSVFIGILLGTIYVASPDSLGASLESKDSTIISDAEKPSTADAKMSIANSEKSTKKEPSVKKKADSQSKNQSVPPQKKNSDASGNVDKKTAEAKTAPQKNDENVNPGLALKEMYTDMRNGFNTRQLGSQYQQWRRYANSILSKTTAEYTGSEITGLGRLGWYEHLYLDPIPSVIEAEKYSHFIYSKLSGNSSELLEAIHDIRNKMDLPLSKNKINISKPANAKEAVQLIVDAINSAYNKYKKALEPLSEPELNIIASEANLIFCSQVSYGHTLPNIGRAKYLIDLMNKTDRGLIYDAAETLLPIFDPAVLKQLHGIQADMFDSYNYKGSVILRVPTKAGDILIGGVKDNVWELDKISNLACVIDLGGNDTYLEGSCNLNRPIFLTIDLGEGNDKYVGQNPGIQGGSTLGISICYNEQGNNTYSAKHNSQGSSIGGVGILLAGTGSDRFDCFMRGQGAALCGLGLLIDRGGNDDYHSALMAQGFGHPGGFGAIVDIDGKDHYYVGGYFLDSYPEHPGYDGWGQGIGAGIRGASSGGIGLCLDGGGNDVYEYDYFAHGGGYWLGIGIARDFGGDDRRIGATLKAYNGQPRTEARWQRFSCGFGCHYSVGYCFDDNGNDFYDATIMALGMAWDLSAGFLVDFNGNDIYAAEGGLTQGTGAEGSIGMLFDYRGNDEYRGYNQGYANSGITYHSSYDCGGNMSFLVDHGGKDLYGSGAANNFLSQRGTSGGFIIDRPTKLELAEQERQRAADEMAHQKAVAEAIAKGVTPPPAPQSFNQNVSNSQTIQPVYNPNEYINNGGNRSGNTGFFGRRKSGF